MDETIQSFAQLLTRYPTWYVWVMEYGITHHQMVLALHQGRYPKTAKVLLLNCISLSGLLQGGPYELNLQEEFIINTNTDDLKFWRLRAADDSFQVVFRQSQLLSTTIE